MNGTDHYFVSSQDVREEIQRALEMEREHLFNTFQQAWGEANQKIKRLEERIKKIEQEWRTQ